MSYMFGCRVSSVNAPSAAVDKLLITLLLDIPMPQVIVINLLFDFPLMLIVIGPNAAPYETLSASSYKQTSGILLASAISATPMEFTFF